MSSGDNGIAAKTVPTGKSLAKTQSLVSKSQTTDAAPSSIVLATAQYKPPLFRGDTSNSVGLFIFASLIMISIYFFNFNLLVSSGNFQDLQ